MTTANKITLVRIAMIPFFIVVALWDFPSHNYVAAVIFAVAAFTDSLDGYVARHYNQVSDFGKFADPLADKFLVVAALLIFVERGQMASWACFLVVAREFAVTGLRLIAMERGGTVIAAAMSGKVKTASSIVCCILMFMPFHAYSFAGNWLTVDNICVAVIVITTLYSGIQYFISGKEHLSFKN